LLRFRRASLGTFAVAWGTARPAGWMRGGSGRK
jgi:hypothetical protein